jgi:uncharacterized surface protein with fasciclin (FAS1) repeats
MVEVKKLLVILLLLAVAAGVATPIVTAQISSQRTVLQNMAGIGDFSTLLSGIRAGGLDDVLKGPGPYTVFAPTNGAFDKLPQGSVNALMKDPAKLNDLLKYHAVPGKLSYTDLSAMTDVKTVDGRTLPINIKDGVLMVGGSKVLNQGIDSSNGIIYPMDSVIVPPGFTGIQSTQSAPLSWLWWLVGAIIIAALAVYLLTRSKKKAPEKYEQRKP